MQFDLSMYSSSRVIADILNRHIAILIAIPITHIKNDGMFVALSPLGLQPAGCLLLSTEVEDSSNLGKLILFEL